MPLYFNPYLCLKPSMDWELKTFAELSVEALYAVLRLRSRVFVLEQRCVYLDLDNKDQQAFHLLGKEDTRLVVYSRLFAPGTYFTEAAIGRIVTAPGVRGRGLGKALVIQSIRSLRKLYPQAPIAISAQRHLQKFYEQLGFESTGDSYLEDGIPHLRMIRKS